MFWSLPPPPNLYFGPQEWTAFDLSRRLTLNFRAVHSGRMLAGAYLLYSLFNYFLGRTPWSGNSLWADAHSQHFHPNDQAGKWRQLSYQLIAYILEFTNSTFRGQFYTCDFTVATVILGKGPRRRPDLSECPWYILFLTYIFSLLNTWVPLLWVWGRVTSSESMQSSFVCLNRLPWIGHKWLGSHVVLSPTNSSNPTRDSLSLSK